MKQFTKIRIYSLAILGAALMLSGSCKKEEDNNTPAPVTVSNTTWDATIVLNATSWHADITFNSDGTTKYDEPANPGAYLSYGTWTLTGDKIHFGIGQNPNYVFDGTISGNTMSGSYVLGGETKTWSAIKRL